MPETTPEEKIAAAKAAADAAEAAEAEAVRKAAEKEARRIETQVTPRARKAYDAYYRVLGEREKPRVPASFDELDGLNKRAWLAAVDQ